MSGTAADDWSSDFTVPVEPSAGRPARPLIDPITGRLLDPVTGRPQEVPEDEDMPSSASWSVLGGIGLALLGVVVVMVLMGLGSF